MRFKSSILRASGVTSGLVSVRKAWSMPSFSNRLGRVRVRSNLLAAGEHKSVILGRRMGFKTGKVMR